MRSVLIWGVVDVSVAIKLLQVANPGKTVCVFVIILKIKLLNQILKLKFLEFISKENFGVQANFNIRLNGFRNEAKELRI